ncbi:MAG TPA: SIS domain-containing protein [Vicinamibacterales bacterium]|nr:SIS domain-containing protein [Vicinamibacterales bacterium]HOQ59405.1 SIS domain-containing protein [Vicinamibacterales bacterium]HPK70511.1 SIS domain-containing protein [Vicinamibacterales bacterium]
MMWRDSRTYLAELMQALRLIDTRTIERFGRLLHRTYVLNRTVFCIGNGGSAALASHLAADLAKLTTTPGQPRLKAMSLADSMAAVTAAANDIGYEDVFVEQLRTYLEPGDVVIAFSTSGRSRNVLRALEYANGRGAVTIGITGADGEPLRAASAESLSIASLSVQQIEDASTVAAHLICLVTRELCLAEIRPDSTDLLDTPVPVEQLRLTLDTNPSA